MRSLKNEGFGSARKELRSVILKSLRLKQKEECPICMEQFVPNDKISILACSERHFMHTDCCVEWLKANNDKTDCLLCRKPVEVRKIKKMVYKGL